MVSVFHQVGTLRSCRFDAKKPEGAGDSKTRGVVAGMQWKRRDGMLHLAECYQ